MPISRAVFEHLWPNLPPGPFPPLSVAASGKQQALAKLSKQWTWTNS